MGMLVEGVWHDDGAIAQASPDWRWHRPASILRHWVTRDGEAGPTGDANFKVEANRYHLFVARNCPWAHRTLILRKLKGLEGAIGTSVAAPRRTDQGWVFETEGAFRDVLLGKHAVHQVYSSADPTYTGRATVPILYDKATGRIVSN